MSLPYQHAKSGAKAREEIRKILQKFGAESVGFMDEFDTHTVILAFKIRGNPIQLRASAQGWANAYLREEPWNNRKRSTKHDYEKSALNQGMVAVNSILRDWVKGQITAIETGILTLEHVFLPYMLAHDGRPVLEHFQEQKLLAGPR